MTRSSALEYSGLTCRHSACSDDLGSLGLLAIRKVQQELKRQVRVMVTSVEGITCVKGRALSAEEDTKILSVVCAVTGQETKFPGVLSELLSGIASLNTATELVVVLSRPDPCAVDILRRLSADCSCMQIYVMKRSVEYATAVFAGLEHAVGDWVATMDIERDEPSIVRTLFDSARREEVDIAVSLPNSDERPLLESLASRAFHRMFRVLHGFDLDADVSRARLLSRAVVTSILCDDYPLIALETLITKAGLRKCVVPSMRYKVSRHSLWETVRGRWRTFIATGAAPIRLANLLSGLAALAAMLYSAYVVAIYLFKDDVAPGWTTLSFMLSSMFMMLALVLWLLSEYMLVLLDPSVRRPRYEIADEFGSQVLSHAARLNVEVDL